MTRPDDDKIRVACDHLMEHGFGDVAEWLTRIVDYHQGGDVELFQNDERTISGVSEIVRARIDGVNVPNMTNLSISGGFGSLTEIQMTLRPRTVSIRMYSEIDPTRGDRPDDG